MTDTPKIRAQFETWVRGLFPSASLEYDEEFYFNSFIQAAWQGWQAASHVLQEAAAPPLGTVTCAHCGATITEEGWTCEHGPKESLFRAQPTATQGQPLANYLTHNYDFSTQEDAVKAMEMGKEIAEGVRREAVSPSPHAPGEPQKEGK